MNNGTLQPVQDQKKCKEPRHFVRRPGCLEQSAIIHSRTVQHRHFQTAH